MRILKGEARQALGLAYLPSPVRDYIAELETELTRVTERQKRLRKNVRSMQAKLTVVNLRDDFARLASRGGRWGA